MLKTKIRFNRPEDVTRFVMIASKCEFDIDVQYHHFFLDGKSLVGLMSIDLNHDLIVYYNNTNPVFEGMLKDYKVGE